MLDWKLWASMEMVGKQESREQGAGHLMRARGQQFMSQIRRLRSGRRSGNSSLVSTGGLKLRDNADARYGFVNEPLRNRQETRVALIPTAPLLKIPKLPKTSPLAGVAPQQPAMNGPSDHEPKMPDMPSAQHGSDGKQRKKETERVNKWMKMMKVAKRDQGGNILQWGWRMDGQGAKVSQPSIAGIDDSCPNESTRAYLIDGGWLLGGHLLKSMLIRKRKEKARGKRKRKI